MPWYFVYANHGGGHMSHTEFYHWEDKKLSKQELENLWHEYFDRYDREYTWPIGAVRLLKKLPIDVKKFRIESDKQKLQSVQRSIRHELAVLDQTPTSACVHSRTRSMRAEEISPFTAKHSEHNLPIASQCLFCGRIKFYGEEKWIVIKQLLPNKDIR